MAHVTVEEHPWPAVIMHWVHLVSFLTLVVTGIIISQPPLGVPMHTVRNIHFIVMFIFIATAVVRVYWALVGRSANTGQTAMVRDRIHFGVEKANRGLFFQYIKYYLFLRKTRPLVPKYNPLQKMTYSILFPLGVIWMAITGFAIWTNTMDFFAPITRLVGGLDQMRVLHYFGMWAMVVFFAIHLYLVIVEDPLEFLPMLFHTAPGGGDSASAPAQTEKA